MNGCTSGETIAPPSKPSQVIINHTAEFVLFLSFFGLNMFVQWALVATKFCINFFFAIESNIRPSDHDSCKILFVFVQICSG